MDGREEVLARRSLDSAGALAVDPAGRLWVGLGGRTPGVVVLSPGLEILETHPLVEPPDHLVCVPAGCVAALRRDASLLVRPGPHERRVPLGRPAVTLAPDGLGRVLAATTDYSPDGPHLANHFVEDQRLTVDVARAAVIQTQPTARRTARQASAGDVDRGLSPMGFDADGDRLATAFAGSDEVAIERPGRPRPTRIDLGSTPLVAPESVALLEGAIAIASPSSGAIGLFRGGALDTLVRMSDPAGWSEAQRKRARGEHTFYEGTRSGVSCQSCHLGGDTDHVMRNIGGQRLAPTLPLGGVAGTAPYLRDGSYPAIADLTHLATDLLGGWLRPEGARGEALEAFVRARPRLQPGPTSLDAVRRGLDVFVEARCPSCHAFPAFTHLGAIPSGALFEGSALPPDALLDTPSLLSLGARGPFLADGRAASLRDVFEEAGRHGDADALDDEALDDLLTFLSSL